MNPSENLVVVFHSRLRGGANLPALEAAGMRMYALASAMPGFRSYKEFTAEDGESVSIVDSTMQHLAGVAQPLRAPAHLAARTRGIHGGIPDSGVSNRATARLFVMNDYAD